MEAPQRALNKAAGCEAGRDLKPMAAVPARGSPRRGRRALAGETGHTNHC